MPPKVIQIACGPKKSSTKYLLGENWQSLTKALKERAELSTIESLKDRGSTLKTNDPIFVVTEGGFQGLEASLIAATSKLKAYVENGGTVVYCALIAPIITKSDMDEIFGEEGFNVGWTFHRYIGYCSGSYDKKVKGRLNRDAEVYTNDSLKLQSAQLPDEIDPFQPLVVTVTSPDHVLYNVVDPEVITGAQCHGVGVMAQVGKGFVGFWGDRDNAVAQTVDVIPAMLGLPPKQQQ
jgi:hypothetical protein